jgi:uncharacterized membrane protein YedE/YeeE
MNLSTYIPSLEGGIIIGLASWLVLISLGWVTGISGIASTALFERRHTGSHDGSWRWFFLIGLIAGGAIFSRWVNIPVPVPRSPWLLITAGVLVGCGTVIGSGCTSGHGVCGLGRRSVRSLVATCIFMTVGALTVWIVK